MYEKYKLAENEIIKKLKKFEKRRENIIGIMYELRDANNYEMALIKYNIYLDDLTKGKTTNDLILKAEEIAKNN